MEFLSHNYQPIHKRYLISDGDGLNLRGRLIISETDKLSYKTLYYMYT